MATISRAALSEYVKDQLGSTFVNLKEGFQYRINHDDCPAGTDTRQRLYLVKHEGSGVSGTIKYFCHNCGHGGVHKIRGKTQNWVMAARDWTPETGIYNQSVPWHPTAHRRRTPASDGSKVSSDITRVDTFLGSSDTASWPILATDFLIDKVVKYLYDDYRAWRATSPEDMSKQLQEFVDNYLIQYRIDTEAIQFPMFTLEGKLYGFQHRRVDGRGSKYLTHHLQAPGHDYHGSIPLAQAREELKYGQTRPCLVVVEDYLSACAIHAGTKRDAFALQGAHLPIETAADLVKKYKSIVVWLDNDSESIKLKADSIRKTFELLGAKATCVNTSSKDPKQHYGAEKRIILSRAFGD